MNRNLLPQTSATIQDIETIIDIIVRNAFGIRNYIFSCIGQKNLIRPRDINIRRRDSGVYINLNFYNNYQLTFVCHETAYNTYDQIVPLRIHCKVTDPREQELTRVHMKLDYLGRTFSFKEGENMPNNIAIYNGYKDFFECIFQAIWIYSEHNNSEKQMSFNFGGGRGKKIKQNKRKQNRSHKRRKTRKSKSRKSKKNRTKKYKH